MKNNKYKTVGLFLLLIAICLMAVLLNPNINNKATITLSTEEQMEQQIYDVNNTEITMKMSILYADLITHVGKTDNKGSVLTVRQNEEWKKEFKKMIGLLKMEVENGRKIKTVPVHEASHEMWMVHLDFMDNFLNDVAIMVYEKDEEALERLKKNATESLEIAESYHNQYLKEIKSIKNY